MPPAVSPHRIDGQQVVFLVPERDDLINASHWESTFAEYANVFLAVAGVSVRPLPWSEAPLVGTGSSQTIYIALLVWGYHSVVD